MTREHKLALIIGFAVVLLVGVLVSDHFSQARRDRAGLDLTPGLPSSFGAAAPVLVSSPAGQGLSSGTGSGANSVTETPIVSAGRGAPIHSAMADEERSTGGPADAGGRRTASSVLTREQIDTSPHQPLEFEMSTSGRRVRNPADAFGGGAWDSNGLTHTGNGNGNRNGNGNGSSHNNGGSSAGAVGVRLASDPLGGRSSEVATPRRHEVQPNETLSQIARRYYGRDNAWREIAKANPGRVDSEGNVRAGVTLIIPALEPVGLPVIGGQGAGNEPSPRQATPPSASPSTGNTPATGTPSRTPAAAPTNTPARTPSSAPPRTGNTGSAVASSSPSSSATAEAFRYHTVQRGEILGTISQNLLGTSRRYREIVALNADVISDPDHVPAGTRLRIPAR